MYTIAIIKEGKIMIVDERITFEKVSEAKKEIKRLNKFTNFSSHFCVVSRFERSNKNEISNNV